ncbi:MAG: V-type ATP synthase subunit E family protein [Monoglobales bacterium]
MTGIEKIVKKIEEDCNVICEDIIKSAQAEAQAILENAQIEAEKIKNEAIEAAKNKCKIDIELFNSKAEHEYKKLILATKISIINEIIEESIRKLKNLPDSEYFNVITMLIKRHAQNGCGEVRFSNNDLNRLPKGFEASLNEMLAGSGKSVVVGKEPVNIDGGVVIVYNDIEQNCTFDSILNASIDEIKDELFEEIFVRNSI